jgi:hypothetical protein
MGLVVLEVENQIVSYHKIFYLSNVKGFPKALEKAII